MSELIICLEACSPLLLGGGLAVGNVQTSRSYVAGSAWRGALAGKVQAGLGQERHAGRPVADQPASEADGADFALVFAGTDPARFGFLYPVRLAGQEALDFSTAPIPLTARSCKRYHGFQEQGHGVLDGLMVRLQRAAGGAERPLQTCPVCAGRLDKLRGFAAWTGASYHQAKVRPRSVVRVGINRYTETAQEQILYTLDVLMPGTGTRESGAPLAFVGAWRGTTEQEAALRRLLAHYLLTDDAGYQLPIGAARARGLGHTRLRYQQVRPQTTLLERLEALQPSARGRLLDPVHDYAALTLRSPLLLRDRLGRPTSQVTGDVLRDYDASAPPGLEVLAESSVVQIETWAGWSSAWGLPKPAGPAVAAGSVLTLRAPRGQRDQLLAYLTALEALWLGERRAEGWGEVLVCDPFHTVHDERTLRPPQEND